MTAGSGTDVPGYGMGVATGTSTTTAGWTCTSATSAQPALRNQATGRFEDVTARAGVVDRLEHRRRVRRPDRDGRLDLFVVNYVDYRS